jgi:outer membrane protein TolC
MNKHCLQLLAIILVMASPLIVAAQQSPASTSAEILTLDQAISLALHDNRQVMNAQLAIGKANDQLEAARTYRRPKFEFNVLAGQQLMSPDFTFTKGVLGNYPNVGPIPNQDIKMSTPFRPTAIFYGQVTQPLSQLHRIRLNIKLVAVSGDISREQLRGQQQSVLNNVKRTYYAIVQTESALDSVRQALAFYRELDRVTGDYVIQQVALKADDLEVKTRLAKTETEELTVSNQVSTLKERLNQLIGRDITTDFKVTPVPETSLLATDLVAARSLALAQRPEIREARLRVKQAELDKRVKRSEYIPDISAALTYASPRNFDSFIPRNFAAAGVVMTWEVFDWGRKKNELAERQKTIEQANNNLRDAESNVMIEVGARMRDLKQAGQALRVARLKQETARENMRVSTDKYKLQATLISDVLQTQATLADSDYQYQQALTAFWTAKAEYEKAIGADK